jgi:hypothetical protein
MDRDLKEGIDHESPLTTVATAALLLPVPASAAPDRCSMLSARLAKSTKCTWRRRRLPRCSTWFSRQTRKSMSAVFRGKRAVLDRQIKHGSEAVTFRDKKGNPSWKGSGRRNAPTGRRLGGGPSCLSILPATPRRITVGSSFLKLHPKALLAQAGRVQGMRQQPHIVQNPLIPLALPRLNSGL